MTTIDKSRSSMLAIVSIVSKDYDETTGEFIGYRQTHSGDDLWFACVELDKRRCPFPFAIDLQDEEEDQLPKWLTDDIKLKAQSLAREIGAKMSCYAIEATPQVAIEFTAFGQEPHL